MGWTANDDKVLFALASDGRSASEVGLRLGKTRSAVLGRAFRTGVQFKSNGCDAQLRGDWMRRSALPATRSSKWKGWSSGSGFEHAPPEMKTKPIKVKETPPALDMPPARGLGAFAAIDTVTGCRWPIGDPRSSDFRFCDARKGLGHSYCAYHQRAAIGGRHGNEEAEGDDGEAEAVDERCGTGG